MAKKIQRIDTQSDTFGGWVERTNGIIDALETIVLTAEETDVPNEQNGGYTKGNVRLDGDIISNRIFVIDEISGGTSIDPSTLNITSEAAFMGDLVSFSPTTEAQFRGNVSLTGSINAFSVNNLSSSFNTENFLIDSENISVTSEINFSIADNFAYNLSNGRGLSYYRIDNTQEKSNVIHFGNSDSQWAEFAVTDDDSAQIKFRSTRNGTSVTNWAKVWTASNHGANSGMDTDLFHGLKPNRFLRRDIDQTYTGVLTFAGSDGASGIIFGDGIPDRAGIRLAYPSNESGRLELWTADDYKEPFVFNAYSGGQDSLRGVGSKREWFRIDDNGAFVKNNPVWHKGYQGKNTGMDADSVHGIKGDNIPTLSGDNVFTASSTFSVLNINRHGNTHFGNSSGPSTSNYVTHGKEGQFQVRSYDPNTGYRTLFRVAGENDPTFLGNKMWHSGNQGHNSNMDSDKLDGLHGSQFLRSDTANTHLRLSNREIDQGAGDGSVWFDSSAGIYIHNTSTPRGTGPAVAWTKNNVQAGNNIRLTYDGETRPRIDVNQGPGSGLDSDTLRGHSDSDFVKRSVNHEITAKHTFKNGMNLEGTLNLNQRDITNIGKLDFGYGDHVEWVTTQGMSFFENGTFQVRIGPDTVFDTKPRFFSSIDLTGSNVDRVGRVNYINGGYIDWLSGDGARFVENNIVYARVGRNSFFTNNVTLSGGADMENNSITRVSSLGLSGGSSINVSGGNLRYGSEHISHSGQGMNEIGSYIFAMNSSSSYLSPGDTISGNNVVYSNSDGDSERDSGGRHIVVGYGTWRAHGPVRANMNSGAAGLFRRIR